jgi:hypothetical protein
MKLVKLAVMFCVALFAALLVSDNGALASLSSRSIDSGSCYSSGVLYPIQNRTQLNSDGSVPAYRGVLTSVTINYAQGIGTLIAQDARGVLQASFSTANVDYILTGTATGFSTGFNTGHEIAGVYTDATTGVSSNVSAAVSAYLNTGSFNYYDYSYNTTTNTVSAVSKVLVGCYPVALRVKNADGAFIWGNQDITTPSCYEFFNESTNTGMNLATLGQYKDTLVTKQ